nr:MAG TPA: hypothetical protein [Caudoviricetes sp.]
MSSCNLRPSDPGVLFLCHFIALLHIAFAYTM